MIDLLVNSDADLTEDEVDMRVKDVMVQFIRMGGDAKKIKCINIGREFYFIEMKN